MPDHRFQSGRTLVGRAISPGYGQGTVYVYHAGVGSPAPRRHIAISDVASEQKRLARAITSAIQELENIQLRVLTEIGESEAQILGAHLALLQDGDFIAKIDQRIASGPINAEAALEHEADALSDLLAAVDNEYLRERVHDIVDVKNRVLKQLGHGSAAALERLPPATVLVAKELLPSDTINLDRVHVSGLVLEHGGPTGHAAILARSMGIPAVGSIHNLLDLVSDGASMLVDGERGEVVINPDPAQAAIFDRSRRSYDHDTAEFIGNEWKASATSDGHPVTLLANIGRPPEVEQVRQHHLTGIGLFRTEYLFMQSVEAPTLSLQRDVYRDLLQRLPSDPVVIRTLDLGGDKQPRFAIGARGYAPFMGARGLRLSLQEPEVFRTQIRAIIEAAQGRDNVAILLPMVISAEDLASALAIIDDVAGQLSLPRLKIGAMLETPSALFELDDILRQADFVSLGTNDLVQFMLAFERRTTEALSGDAIFQPAMLRAVHGVAQRAAAHGKSLTLCGEAAGDPIAACLLVGLGIDRLSMSPVRAARVRAAVRSHSRSALQNVATRALEANRRTDVIRIARELL